MSKHKLYFLLFTLSIILLHYYSGEVSKAESNLEPGYFEGAMVGTSLILGTLSLIKLHEIVESYVSESHNIKERKEVGAK